MSAAGSYVVQIDVPAIGSLILDAPDATIGPVGSFALSGLLDVKAGTFSVSVSDTITGGTIRPDGGTITYNGGTLDGVILDGPLDLSAEGAFVTIADGIDFTGTVQEQILLTGYDSGLAFTDAVYLNDVAISAESTSFLGTGDGLTLGPSSTLTIHDDYSAPRSAFFGAVIAGNLFSNFGTVTVDGPLDDIATSTDNDGTVLVENGNTNLIHGMFTNTGTLEVSGSDVELTVSGVLANSGSVSLAAGATLVLDGGVDNTSTITLAPGTTLYVNGNQTFDQLGIIDRDGGTLDIGEFGHLADLDLSGRILDVTKGGEFDGVQFAGEVTGGTIELDGGAVSFTGATGFGVTVDLEVAETINQFDANGYLFGATVEIGDKGALDLAGRTLHVSTGQNFGAEFNGLILAGTVAGGTVELDGGPVTYAGGTLDGVTLDGTLDLGAQGAFVNIIGGIAFSGTAPEQILVTGTGAYLALDGDETLDHVAIDLGNAASCGLVSTDAILTLGPDSTLAIAAGGGSLAGGVLNNAGSITAAGFLDDQLSSTTNTGSIALIDGSGDNNLVVDLTNSGTLTLSGTDTQLVVAGGLANSGDIAIGGGDSLGLYGIVNNTGTIALAADASLEVNASNTLGTITFLDRTGILRLDAAAARDTDGTLSGFAAGDVVELDGTGYDLIQAGNTLDVSRGGGVVDTFVLAGQDYTNAGFSLTETGSGQTDLTTDAPCFCAGTLILTDRGERPVEALQAGDLVVTRRDGIDILMPVRWIGQRRLHVARHPEPEQVAPIRILRDAVAPGVPCRDLRVSPDHAVLLDEMLIQARQLVNGMTIRPDIACTVVTYHHVELDRHAILVADGLACESYLDTGNRTQFDNNVVVALHGRADPQDGRTGCVSLATDAALVRPLWDRLADRAAARGHARPDLAVTHDPALRLEADGMPIEPTDAANGLIRFHLPPGCQEVRLRSSSDRPTTLSPWCDDRRRLGIALSAIILRQGAWRQDLPLHHLPADAGWWPVESSGNLSWRWSNGDALITLPEPGDTLDITLHAVMPVAVRPVAASDPSRADRQPAQAGIDR